MEVVQNKILDIITLNKNPKPIKGLNNTRSQTFNANVSSRTEGQIDEQKHEWTSDEHSIGIPLAGTLCMPSV